MKQLLFIVALLGLALSACAPTPTAAPAPENTAAPTSDPAIPADAVPYANTEGDFSMLLPAGWTTVGPLEVVLNGFPGSYHLYALGPDAGAAGGPGVSQIIIADEKAFTVEQFAQSMCSTCSLNPASDSSLGGLPAIMVSIGGGAAPATDWVFVIYNGKLIGFSIRPLDENPLDWVLASIQFEK
jgi:hypothetical protein